MAVFSVIRLEGYVNFFIGNVLQDFYFPTILAKIYKTNFSVSVKQRTIGKVQFQF